jgi:penicillin-binding protein 1C
MARRGWQRWAAFLAVVAVLAGTALSALDRWIARTQLPDLSPELSVTVLDRDGLLLRAYTVADGRWRLPVEVGDVDPGYLAQLIAYEDKRFYRHAGVDPLAMLRAVAQALLNGRIVSGGSTLTMQVARLLEEAPTGDLGAKLRQIRLALALERRLGKDEILNLYLKLAPFGGNIEGIRAASLSYFGKEPRRLTPGEAALLVALPQAPEARRPDRNPAAAQSARDRVLARVAGAGVLQADEAAAATTEPTPARRKEFPLLSAHLADRALDGMPDASVHRLTIERPLQRRLEALVRERATGFDRRLSAAMVVADHATGEILASIGSPDMFDADRGGYLDMTRALRSPGSTLKPLIYGLAFEAGLAHPESLVEDRPTAFGTYAPQNFDNMFRGTVSIRRALQLSLNIPAVTALDAVGPARLLARMRRAGLEPRLPGGSPAGLAIGLGGLGLSLRDLVALYAGIAGGGGSVALVERAGGTGSGAPRKQVLSPEAAWQVADILADAPAPPMAVQRQLAYKTGTSYGYRDAWAIGFDGRYVIGVWIGRPDGASAPGTVGIDQAAPLLFDAFGRLGHQPLEPLRPPPPGVLMVSNAELPLPLRRLRRPGSGPLAQRGEPEIAFPPDQARVDLGLGAGRNGSGFGGLSLKVRNGTPPYVWIVNDAPLEALSYERATVWRPDGPGFVTISVVDADGNSDRIGVFLQ